MRILNYTGKDIEVMSKDGEVFIIKPEGKMSGNIARANSFKANVIDHVGRSFKIKVNETKFSNADTLPAPQDNVLFVVPIHTYLSNPDRKDFITADGTKRENGKVYVTSFCFKKY